jgi:hypothetical protein
MINSPAQQRLVAAQLEVMDEAAAVSTAKLEAAVESYREASAGHDPVAARFALAASLLALPNTRETIAALVDMLTVAVAKLAERPD